MATIFIPPLMRELTGGVAQVIVEGATLRDVFAAIDRQYPGLQARVTASEALAPGIVVSIDGTMTSRMLAPVRPESEIHILPAIGGGN